MKNRDAIIQRIKKLKAHAESAAQLGSLAEAEVFTAKYQELLNEYNIAMFEVDQAKEADQDILRNFTYTEAINYKHQIASRWLLHLIRVLCKNNFCRFTFNSSAKYFRVYGDFNNVDSVVWLFHYLRIGLENLAKEEYKKDDLGLTRHNFIAQFLIGAAHGIDEKLTRARQEAAKASNLYAVVKYNDKALDLFSDRRLGKLRVKNIKEEKNVGPATALGYEAGKNYNVNAPIEAEKKSKKSLN